MKHKNSKSETMRVVVFKDCDLWIAQCLEYDIAVQAKKLDELKDKFICTIQAHIQSAIENKEAPFENIPQTPRSFWELYRRDNILEKPLKMPRPPRRKIHGKDLGEFVPKQASLALSDSPNV